MGRRWVVEIGGILAGSAGLAWLLSSQPRSDQIPAIIGAIFIGLGLLALLQSVDPFAGMLDRVGLGRPHTQVERRLSFVVAVAAAISTEWLHIIGGDRPSFLFAFVWLAITFIVLMGFYRTARRRLLGAAW